MSLSSTPFEFSLLTRQNKPVHKTVKLTSPSLAAVQFLMAWYPRSSTAGSHYYSVHKRAGFASPDNGINNMWMNPPSIATMTKLYRALPHCSPSNSFVFLRITERNLQFSFWMEHDGISQPLTYKNPCLQNPESIWEHSPLCTSKYWRLKRVSRYCHHVPRITAQSPRHSDRTDTPRTTPETAVPFHRYTSTLLDCSWEYVKRAALSGCLARPK